MGLLPGLGMPGRGKEPGTVGGQRLEWQERLVGCIEDLLLLIAECQWAARIDTGRGMFAEHQGMALPIAGPPTGGQQGYNRPAPAQQVLFLAGWVQHHDCVLFLA